MEAVSKPTSGEGDSPILLRGLRKIGTVPDRFETASRDSSKAARMDPFATPALVIDAKTVFRNIERMATYAADHEFDLRPHTKTHKSRQIGALQMSAGAIGLTAAKVGEAELMAEVADDVLLAYPAVDPARTGRLVQLAAHGTIRVAADSKQCAKLWATPPIGTAPRSASWSISTWVWDARDCKPPPRRLKLAQYVDATPGLRLDGLFCYPGHIASPPGKQEAELLAVSDKLAETLKLWAEHGLQARIVSGGSTPTAYQSHLIPEYTEIRPGTYIYNDMNTVRGRFLPPGGLCREHHLHGHQHRRAGTSRDRRRQQDPDERHVRAGPR